MDERVVVGELQLGVNGLMECRNGEEGESHMKIM